MKVNFAIQMWQLLGKSILWLSHHGNIEVKWWRKKFRKLFFMAKRSQRLMQLLRTFRNFFLLQRILILKPHLAKGLIWTLWEKYKIIRYGWKTAAFSHAVEGIRHFGSASSFVDICKFCVVFHLVLSLNSISWLKRIVILFRSLFWK